MTRDERIKTYRAAVNSGMTGQDIANMTGDKISAVYQFCNRWGIKLTYGKGQMTDQQLADIEILRINGIPEDEARKIVTRPRVKVPLMTPQQAAEARRKLGMRS